MRQEIALRRYVDVRRQVCDGDLLLWRRRGLISIAGRGIHSHAAMASWWAGDLCALEMVEFKGGRAVTLDSQVERAPGRIDVYQANPEDRWPQFNRSGAVQQMRLLCGQSYGYWNIWRAALLHLPVVRMFVRAETDDRSNGGHPPFCSAAVAQATRIGGGVDVVPNLADRLTEPADLARSMFYRYRFTLT